MRRKIGVMPASRCDGREQELMARRWLRQLIEAVSGCWEWHALALSPGVRYRRPQAKDDGWEVWVYPAVQEVVGGPHDGKTGWCGFDFDVSRLLEGFEAGQVSARTRLGKDPPELVVDGLFRGQVVLLHLCLEPPEQVEATEVIDLTGPGGASVREKS
jgi:hypothetical protein